MLPEAYLEGLDRLVGMNRFSSRSTAIRCAVMDLLKRELWRQEKEERFQMAKMKMNRRKVVHGKSAQNP